MQAFPALSELIAALHALPYELNSKVSALQLSVPLPGATMLSQLQTGAAVFRRLYGAIGDQTTGFAVTAVYFIGTADWQSGQGGEVTLSSSDTAYQPVTIEPQADRLLLFDSRQVWFERAAVCSPEPQWAVVFCMHGSSLEKASQ